VINLAEFSITRVVITWAFMIFLVAGGLFAYAHIGRLEDPEFTIKEAVVITQYPGATPQEVEKEVTDRIEKAVQKLSQVKRVESVSKAGISEVNVIIKDKYNKHGLPQVWDELRRKVGDIQSQLPQGVKRSIVNDDFGDVYGMYYALVGKGFSHREMKDYAEILEKSLLLVPGVAKVNIGGVLPEQIFVEVSRGRIAQLGISLEAVYKTLAAQNLVAYSGHVRVGQEYIRIQPTGAIETVKAIKNLLVFSPTSKKLIRLHTFANVARGYQEVPRSEIYYNGEPAVTIGVSMTSGVNVVKIGQAVEGIIQKQLQNFPLGLQIHSIYQQPKFVEQSVQAFVISVLEALAIVIAVLLLAMGLRSGMIIGVILLLVVLGTLMFMYFFGIQLERISLGALIIALGMMVDNAIVVVEGILVKTQAGMDKLRAAKEVVQQTQWPLFGATLVGIFAFAAIGLSNDATGEYTASLFYVILISLLLSWILAITIAPYLCHSFLKTTQVHSDKDPYQGLFFRSYKGLLYFCLKRRLLTVIVMVALLGVSVIGFGYLKPGFFPDSTTPMFLVNYWRAEGTDIRATSKDMRQIEKHIRKLSGVSNVTTVVGQGAIRFSLVYKPEKANSSYGQFLVEVKDYRAIDAIARQVVNYLQKEAPNSEPTIDKIRLGPGGGAKIAARFSGPDPAVLRQLAAEAASVFHANPQAIDIRDDWRQRIKIIEPVYSDNKATQAGISRGALSDALQMAFSGKQVGVYREGDELIPIISRWPDKERLNVANIDDVPIWSPLLKQTVPVGQVVSQFNTRWENAIIHRRDRLPTLTVSCNPKSIPAGTLLKQLMPKIQAIKLPAGYHMEWGGEYESAHDAQVALAAKIPMSIIAMIFIVILLFNAVRQPLIIWLCVPLSLIGVTAGLLITDKAFEFMALLGFLSLTGMLIKNAVVLIDQIDVEIKEGKDTLQAIIDSSMGRLRPVVLAAVTTVLGMIPLLFDAFFSSMAVTIMAGLTFATVLTMVIVPVLYAIFFKAKAIA